METLPEHFQSFCERIRDKIEKPRDEYFLISLLGVGELGVGGYDPLNPERVLVYYEEEVRQTARNLLSWYSTSGEAGQEVSSGFHGARLKLIISKYVNVWGYYVDWSNTLGDCPSLYLFVRPGQDIFVHQSETTLSEDQLEVLGTKAVMLPKSDCRAFF